MREQATIPGWALDHIRGKLLEGEEVINAVSFRHGLFSGLVLFNTSKGAAIVAKTLVGDPESVLLTFPRDLKTFTCRGCGGRNLLVDVDTPADVFCTHCGSKHHLVATGNVRAAKGKRGTARGAPEQAAPLSHAAAVGDSGVQGEPYRHGYYTLYRREAMDSAGRSRTQYFFAKGAPRIGRESPLPAGYEVVDTGGEPKLRPKGQSRRRAIARKAKKATKKRAGKRAPKRKGGSKKRTARKATKRRR